ncbi:MAG: phosphate ABC transporter substrate-binding protein PstS [Deltaproteobacteria bacterium]|nr:phosphate ABC transporter substrate-binding protein PstS [Deltaproteobacteria bacterium]
MKQTLKKKILALAITTFAVFSFSTAQAEEMVKLNGAGATFPYPLYSKWFSDYNKVNPNVQINYQSIGSGGGIQQLKSGTVDFGASDAPLSEEEEKGMPAPVVQIPAVGGAVVVVYNLPGVASGLKLSADVVADLFLGKIKSWNDARVTSQNPGVNLPNTPVAVIHRSDGSGTTYIFSDYLAKVSSDFFYKVGRGKSINWPVGIGGKGNEGVTGQVKQIPGAIGYVEYAYALNNKLSFAAIKNKAGKFVEASPANSAAAFAAMTKELQKDSRTSVTDAPGENSYPISGLTYLMVYKKAKDVTKGKAFVDFLKWAMTTGQTQAVALQYAPLSAELVKINEGNIASISP